MQASAGTHRVLVATALALLASAGPARAASDEEIFRQFRFVRCWRAGWRFHFAAERRKCMEFDERSPFGT